MAAISGGELVVRMLVRAKVETVFALHGAHVDTIFQACADHGIAIVDTRHEAAAGHAAEGYARSLRTLGVALVTAGPGLTNIVTSMANAFADRTPVLYLSGAAGLGEAETNGLQSQIDLTDIARPVTKWAHRVGVTQDIPRLMAQAIRTATSGVPGPVMLELPADILRATVDEDSVRIPRTIGIEAAPAPRRQDVAAAIDLLLGAKRPLVMVGDGAWYAGAGGVLREFVEVAGIPVFSDFQAHGLLPGDHPLYGGTFHKLADFAAPGERPDVVLAVGARFGLFTLGVSDRIVPLSATLIHVEADPREIGRVMDAALAIAADPRETLRALAGEAKARAWPGFHGWQDAVRQAKENRRRRLTEAAGRGAGPLHPYLAVSAIVENLDEDTIVVGDGAESYAWLNEVVSRRCAGSYLTHGFLGAMGIGLGLALGAQAAHRSRRVLCVTGDGAIGFTIAEFDTMVRHGLPVVVVVMNNRSWGASRHYQEANSAQKRIVATALGNASYDRVAAGFGCHAQHVSRIEELGPALRAAFASGMPACIDVAIDPAPIPPELLLMRARTAAY